MKKLTPFDFVPYFNKEIKFSDCRSNSMPLNNAKGTLIGIRLNEVELRVNNILTSWYPINHASVVFNIESI